MRSGCGPIGFCTRCWASNVFPVTTRSATSFCVLTKDTSSCSGVHSGAGCWGCCAVRPGVFCREGRQEGARKGYNPARPGDKCHHPLLAVLAEAPFVLHGWLRSGNTRACRGVVAFMQEALALLPEGSWIRTVRADSGFFDQALMELLEERTLPYVIVAKLTPHLKRQCAGIKDWTIIDVDLAIAQLHLQLLGWSKARRFVVVRQRIREDQTTFGRRLLEVPGYTFRMWVTNRSDSALELWHDYNGRAAVEQRIEELKHDLSVHSFCLRPFFATESAFLTV